MTSLRLAAACVVAAGAAGAVVGLAGPAHADTVDGSWWSQLNTGLPVSLPVAVPTLPALSSDLTVQELPSGPAAVAAIRLPVPDGTVPTTLTVHYTTPAPTAALAGCATAFTWASASGGTWSARPDCNGDPVAFTNSADGTTATLDLTRIDQTTINRSGVIEVLVAPAAGSVAFSASLSAPVTTDLTTRGAAASAAPAAAPAASAAAATAASSPKPGTGVHPAAAAPVPVQAASIAPAAAPAAPAPAPVAAAPGTLAAPPVVAAGPAPGPVVAASAAAVPVVPGSGSAVQPQAAASVGLTHTNRRLPALLLLLLALATAVALPLRSRVPVLLTGRGASATAPELPQAGLGRHRSPRTGRPPRL